MFDSARAKFFSVINAALQPIRDFISEAWAKFKEAIITPVWNRQCL